MTCAKSVSIIWVTFPYRISKSRSRIIQRTLKEIITKARKDNPHLPIYVVGIYNPLYLNFPELTNILTAVDRWNERDEETIAQFDLVYFVPINDLLYKGIDGKMGVSEVSDGKIQPLSRCPSEEDSFHPNNTGYEKMKQAILEKINATRKLGVVIIPSTRRSPSLKKLTFGNGCFRFGEPLLALGFSRARTL